MGLLDGLDNMASGGLLGQLQDPSEITPQMKRQRRSSLLMNLGSALSEHGFGGLGEGMQNYQQGQLQQLMFLQALKQQAAQQQQQQQLQGMTGQVFQPPTPQAPLPPPGAMQGQPPAPPPPAMMQGASINAPSGPAFGSLVPGMNAAPPPQQVQAPDVPMAPPPMPPTGPIASPGGFQPPPVAQTPQDQLSRIDQAINFAASRPGMKDQAEGLQKMRDAIEKSIPKNENTGTHFRGKDGNWYILPKEGMPVNSGIAAPPENDTFKMLGDRRFVNSATGQITELPPEDKVMLVNDIPAIQKGAGHFVTLAGDPIDPNTIKTVNPIGKEVPEKIDQLAIDDWMKDHPGKNHFDAVTALRQSSRAITNISMTPDQQDTTAGALVAGKVDPATARAMLRRNPGLLSAALKLDPGFDEVQLDKRYGTAKEFNNSSNTKAGGQVLALNTLIHHAELYQQAAEALHNGTFKPGNAAYNAVATAFGSAPPQSADLIARFFAGETGKVATGGIPAEGEINGILKNLSSANSPAQIAGAGKSLLQIAGGRAIPLMEKLKDAKLDGVYHVLGQDAQSILRRRGFDPNTMQPAAAGAPVTSAPDMVRAQIPGQPPGFIHRNQVGAFQKKYPGAVIGQ